MLFSVSVDTIHCWNHVVLVCFLPGSKTIDACIIEQVINSVRSRPKPWGASQKVVSNLFEIKQKIPRSMNLVFSIIKKKPQVCIGEISTLSFDPDKNNQSVSMSLQNPPALSGYGAGHGLYLVSHEYKVEPRTPGPQRRPEKGVF